MSVPSRISVSISPLLWLAPVPFVLAMCLPLEPRAGSEPVRADRLATATAPVETLAQAASAPLVSPR